MNIDIVRRIAERGLKHAQREEDSIYCDIFQHMLDEIEHIEHSKTETVIAFRKLADKVRDPKWQGQNDATVFSKIALEIAEELEVESML